MTYPTMFMGVGNLVCMPLAMAIGRRPVYLGSLVLLVVGGVLAAYAKDYQWHLGARMLLGFAAGNSEALVPMMIQVRKTAFRCPSRQADCNARKSISYTNDPRASAGK